MKLRDLLWIIPLQAILIYIPIWISNKIKDDFKNNRFYWQKTHQMTIK